MIFLPIGVEYPYKRAPLVTSGLLVACIVVFLLQEAGSVPESLLLYPDAERFHWWQTITSGFLHGGVEHLAGNMLFLWVYGRYMEERLGPGRFLLSYLLTMVLASLAFIQLSEPLSLEEVIAYVKATGSQEWLQHPWVPALGASGAIAGVMGMTVVSGPGALVRFWVALIFPFPYIGRLYLPAILVLGFWFAKEYFFLMSDAGGGVAFSAHVGGFLAGVLLGAFLRFFASERSAWHMQAHRRATAGWEAPPPRTRRSRTKQDPWDVDYRIR